MTTKTADEIAAATLKRYCGDRPDECAHTSSDISEMITYALTTDREQRDLYELIAKALDERAENDYAGWAVHAEPVHRAARAIRDGEQDDIWDRFIGPMLDQIETELGR
ncbi:MULTISPECIES: hypothetical protein [unclassified Leucobacter]|uniref:hypothetical protein n=1 Tax=unclassified Leucobacter TaxID=2621730 RepID=UPI0030185840